MREYETLIIIRLEKVDDTQKDHIIGRVLLGLDCFGGYIF